MTAADLIVAQLDALLAATPAPRADAEPDELLELHEAISAARDRLIGTLVEAERGLAGDRRIRERALALAQRDQTWHDALTRARTVVGDRLTAVRRARAYR